MLQENDNNVNHTKQETVPLTFDEARKIHNKKLRKIRNSGKLRILYERYYRLLSFLQEPRNTYQMTLETGLAFADVKKLMARCIRLNLIQVIEYNPNKYKLTQKGRYTLFKIVELNQTIEHLSKKLTKHNEYKNIAPNRERTRWTYQY